MNSYVVHEATDPVGLTLTYLRPAPREDPSSCSYSLCRRA